MHSDCSYFFKPSVEEVIKQIPEILLDKVNAFELHSADLTPNSRGLNSAKVTLYKIDLPKKILDQPVICEGITYKEANDINTDEPTK